MIIVKVGGSEGIDYDTVCDDVAALVAEGQKLISVSYTHLTLPTILLV